MKTTSLLICLSALLWAPLRAQDAADSNSAPVVAETNLSTAVEEPEHPIKPAKRRFEPARVPIVFKKDVFVRTNETADNIVVIAGSANVDGKVSKDIVAIGGDIQIDGEARDVVAVLGSVKLGPHAKVSRNVSAIGGSLEIAPGATFGRRPFELDLGGLSHGLRQWIIQCLFKFRPLAPQVGWVWLIAFLFFAIYLVIALIMPAAVRACATAVNDRPATTFLMGILVKLLVPVIFAILAATGFGAIIIPFIAAAVAFGALIGKTALFAALGAGVTRKFGASLALNSLVAFLIGIIIITLLYMVPLVGFLTLGVVSVWGLGGAVTAGFGAWRRESPEPAAPSSMPAATAGLSTTPLTGAPSFPGETSSASAGTAAATATIPTVPANVPEALSYRRATFWERMGAGALDCVVVGIVGGLLHGPPLGFIAALAYFAGMWTWKGTTLGGTVLGLKVVRLDGQKLTFTVALVRALASVLSIFTLFLGFLWIGWDREKQAWHDKIAGTVVVRFPRSIPLVCL